ncbi:MAG TPA: Asp-tRNA(Asn)/Glu-tRNA(Gln) amidotransferase GatCAB subunit B, partial [Caldimonas sp.]|nr:Asp-tRNA(Asn)/Glu-tRNA(Gln) amidotransferase GatCAB subunit B [Caldimonas sp.]
EDGGTVRQATVLFDPETAQTRAMRTKEDAHDYRYFPDPDLPPLVIEPAWVERVLASMPELPQAMAERFVREWGLPAYDAATLTQTRATAEYFEAAARAASTAGSNAAKLVANWLMGEIARRLNASGSEIDGAPVRPQTLAALVARIADGTISNNAARQVFESLWNGEGTDVDALIDAKGLRQVSDRGALEQVVDEVLAANAKSVAEFKAGKEKAFNALVGQAMKATRGKANPEQVGALLRERLAKT